MGIAQSNRRGSRSPRQTSPVSVVEVWPDGSTSHAADEGPHPSDVPDTAATAPQATATPVEAPTSPASVYDPSAHVVADVVAYMAEHPDEADAIRAAEAAGKARKGIIEAS